MESWVVYLEPSVPPLLLAHQPLGTELAQSWWHGEGGCQGCWRWSGPCPPALAASATSKSAWQEREP